MARIRSEWRSSLTTPTRTDLRPYLQERYGRKGEALYMFVAGFVAIAVSGLAAFFLGRPLLFPSLSPAVFLIFRFPLSENASPRNTITGHFVAIGVGYACLYLFGVADEPSVLQVGATLPYVWAAATSVAVTEALLILINRPHTPAGATTLLVGLGIFTSISELVSLGAGIVLITVTSWIINRSLGAPVPVWSPRGG